MRLPMARELAGAGVRVIAGLIAQVVPDDQCLPMAVALAHRIANAPIAVQMAKDAALASQEAGLAHERRNFVLALRTDDCREGARA
jgi:enoyl-CoA hydratase